MQLVSHQEQHHTEALIGAKKNQEQLNLAVKEDKVQRMTQKMMTHQLHQAQAQAEIPENIGIKRNLTKEREVTIMNQSTTTKRKRKNKQRQQKKEGQEVPQKVQLVGNQEELQQLGIRKKEGQEVPQKVQQVGNQEELQQLGIRKKEGQEVPQKVQLVGNQEELQQLGIKKKEGQEVPHKV